MNADNKLSAELKRHEGVRKNLYKCSAGYWTIGVGRNIQTNGLSDDEIELLLHNDIQTATADAEAWAGADCWTTLDEPRKAVIINMAFNMGAPTLAKFKNFREAVRNRDYPQAAAEMLDSRWARQVGGRANELAERMKTGEWA